MYGLSIEFQKLNTPILPFNGTKDRQVNAIINQKAKLRALTAGNNQNYKIEELKYLNNLLVSNKIYELRFYDINTT